MVVKDQDGTLLEKYLSRHSAGALNKAAVSYLASLDHLMGKSPVVATAILQELKDQRSFLKLIASENYSSLTTQLAMGNLLTDKYSEGIAKKRFYAGCDNVDVVEELACSELKKIYGCDHAYVQPHSGADANLVAFWAILTEKVQSKELDRLGKKTIQDLTDEEHEILRKVLLDQSIMGMSLSSGGHLTHGYRLNISSKFFRAHAYDVDPVTERLDYDALARQAKSIKPTILLAGYSAYPRLLNFAKLRQIADDVGAVLMVDMAHFSGLVAGKAIVAEYDPIAFAHVVSSTTHKTLRGPRGGMVLCKEAYKDAVDKGCPFVLGGPLPHVMAAKAIAFQEVNTPSFKEYARQIIKNAKAMAEEFLKHGVVLFSGGTDNHLMVVNVEKSFGINGRQAEIALRKAKITVNRNMVPFDTNGPWYTSGIRLGTPAMTTLGMKEDEMRLIAKMIIDVLKVTKQAFDEKTSMASKSLVEIEPSMLHKVQGRVGELLQGFPLYPELEIE